MVIKFFKQYLKIISTMLIAVCFGFASFFLFLNLYHYNEVRRVVYVEYDSNSLFTDLEDKLNKIESNANIYKNNGSSGSLSYNEASSMSNKLNTCVKSFRNQSYKDVTNDNLVDIVDVYNLTNSFKDDVLNTCIVSQFYGLTSDNSNQNYKFFKENKLLIKGYMDSLIASPNYLVTDLENNSSYYFNTDIVSLTVKNNTRDGLYEIMSDYNKAADFVYAISEWYKDSIKGGTTYE